MCRLLGYCARDNASLAEIMGEPGLQAFTALSSFHGDGWGMAWYDHRQLHVKKSPQRAADEPAFTEHAHRRLGELLPAAWEGQLAGTTDSERYFLNVMSGLEAHGGDMIAALDDTAARVDSLLQPNSLNAVFLTPDALYAVCWYHPERIPHTALAARAYDGPTECYFEVSYLETDGAVVVASSGWPQEGWTSLPNRHVLVVDRDTLQAKVVPLR